MPADGSLHRTANGYEPVVRGIRIAKDGKCYKLTLFAKRGMTGRMVPETYVIQQKGGAMFIDTGFHIDMTYHRERDMLTFSTNGEYVRKQ